MAAEAASFSAAALTAAALLWHAPPPGALWVRGQIVGRRKVARGLIFIDLCEPQPETGSEPEQEEGDLQQLGGRPAAVCVWW